MKNKLKYGLTLAALTFLVGCSDKGSIQRPSIGSGPTVQDSESTSEIDPVELSNYQYYPLPDKTLAIAVGNNKYLEKLTLPEQYQGRKVTQIVENGFKDCKALREISIPSSVLTVGNYAFLGCSSLTSVVIPNSVTNIGNYAFWGCSSLTSVVIPNSVTSIGNLAFCDCSSLAIYCQAKSEPSGWTDSWNPSNRPVVWGCIRAGNQDGFKYGVSSLEGVESATITGYAGSDTSIAVPETIGGVEVTAIAKSAFYDCTSLTSIVIPESVTSIGDSAFSICTSLTSILIPEGVTTIGDEAFSDCTSLTSILIPEGVTTIGYRAFGNCFNLTICCKAKSEPRGWTDSWNPSNRPVVWGCIRAGNQGCFEYAVISIEGAESATITGYAGSDASIAVPETIGGVEVTAIAVSAFEGCTSLTSVVIPNSVTNIGVYAFFGCSSLTSIVIPESVTSIGISAFAGCTSLASIAIPNSVTNIGGYAFDGCSSLKGVVIPEGVTSIGAYAFHGCSSLTIYCQAQSKPSEWHKDWNYSNRPVVWGCLGIGTSGSLNYRIDYKNGEESITITGCAGADSEAVIPETIGGVEVTAIADSAFKGRSSLKGIVIPDGVTTIGDEAFAGCTSLTSIVIPDGVTTIGDEAFAGCTSLTSIVIPEGVTTIGAYAFYNCSSLTICCQAQSKPSGWNDYWNGSGCSVVWGCIRAGNQDCFEYAVISIEGAESATITGYTGSDTGIAVPETIGEVEVTAIADSAFARCTSLTGIVIPEGVTAIGAFAFWGCSSLTSIVIPEGVTAIGYFAFLGCASLTDIAIPNSVTNIGYRAFYGCSSLTIYCQAQSKPSGWDYYWNDSDCPVVWGYSGNGTSGSLN